MTSSHDAKQLSLQAIWFRCIGFWREGHQQARKDLRTRWRAGGFRFLVVVWLSGLCLCILILARLSSITYFDRVKTLPACQPDGKFSLTPAKYQYWSKPSFFEITVGHGNLSFTQAKAIDIVWDIVGAHWSMVATTLVWGQID
jgi:hypothetical protein